MSKNSKDESVRKTQGDVRKVPKKLYQLEEVMQLTPGRFECAIPEAPLVSKFCEQVGMYMGALLNSYGGIVRWGVTRTGLAKVKVIGTHCDRKMEDEYKVAVDCVAKGFSPRVDPSLYRLDFVEILRKTTNQPFREFRVIELRVQAGQELLYMDQEQRVRVVNGSTVYGPLIPQEIKRLVLKKYRKELLDSQSLLEVITPLVGRPLPGAVTPLSDRPPCGVSVDTQTSPALCHGNGKNVTVQAAPMQSHTNKSKVACPGTPMPSFVTASQVHSATPLQTHTSTSSTCSITPMHAHVSNSKLSSPIETPKQNLQTALETSVCTPYVGKESSNSADLTGCGDSVAKEPKQNLQDVLETSACTPVGSRSVSRTGASESCENESESGTTAEKPSAETNCTDVHNSPKLPAKQGKLATEGSGPQDTLQGEDVGAGENMSEGQDVPEEAAKGAEVPSVEQKEETKVSSRRDSIGTFAHKLLEESLDAKKDPKADSDGKENESPATKETESASSSSKTVSNKSLAEKVKNFLQDVKQKITRTKETDSLKEECMEKGSKMLKAEGNVKVGKKEDESERKRRQPQQPASSQPQKRPRNDPQNTYRSKLFNQAENWSYNQQPYNQQSYNQQPYNQQSYNQQSYNQQSYNQQSYNHLLQAAFPSNQEQPYNQAHSTLYRTFVAGRFDNGQQGRYPSHMSGVDPQGWYSANVSEGDHRHFYQLRQQAAIRDTWRNSYY